MKGFFPTILIFLICASCEEKSTLNLAFFEGTWKREHKEQYEVWEQMNELELTGYSYRIENHQKVVSETLSIKKTGDHMVFEAKVPDQNEGVAIPFILNTAIDSLFSFENSQHDFPKKIQYQKMNKNQLLVRVIGNDNSGFSYVQTRQ